MARGSALSLRYQGGAGYLKGIDKLIARCEAIPESIRAAMKDNLNGSADELVADIKAIAPVAEEFEKHPGELRDSVHKQDGRTELSVQVIEDPVDKDGRGYAPPVEWGHKFADGSHAEAKPHFFPAVRRAKPKLKARTSRAMSKAIKDAGS